MDFTNATTSSTVSTAKDTALNENGNRKWADAYLKKTLIDTEGNAFIIEGGKDEWLFHLSKDGTQTKTAHALIMKQQAYLDALTEYNLLVDKTDAVMPVEPVFTMECKVFIPPAYQPKTETASPVL